MSRECARFHPYREDYLRARLSEKAVQDAIRIASDQLCGVSDLLRKGANITKEYEILESRPRLPARKHDPNNGIDKVIQKSEETNQ